MEHDVPKYTGKQQGYKSTCIMKRNQRWMVRKLKVVTSVCHFSDRPTDRRCGQILGRRKLTKPWEVCIIIIFPVIPQRDIWSFTQGSVPLGKTTTLSFWVLLDTGFKTIFTYGCTHKLTSEPRQPYSRKSLLLTIPLHGALPNERRNHFFCSFFSLLFSLLPKKYLLF